jgi:hypothetical protein
MWIALETGDEPQAFAAEKSGAREWFSNTGNGLFASNSPTPPPEDGGKFSYSNRPLAK